MKKLMLILGFSSILLPACSGPGDAPDSTQVRTRICAAPTKVTAGPEDSGRYPALWQEGDCISVNGKVSQPLGASFSGVSDAVFSLTDFSSEAPFNMLYPASTDGTVLLDGSVPAMYAVSQSLDEVAQFHQLTAGILVKLYGELSLSSLTLESVGGESVGGVFSVALSTGSLSQVSAQGRLERTFDMPSGLSMDTPLVICWYIKPGTYSKGLSLRARSPQGSSLSWSFASGKALEAGKMYAVEPLAFVAPVPNIPDDVDDPVDPASDGIAVSLEEMTELAYGYEL